MAITVNRFTAFVLVAALGATLSGCNGFGSSSGAAQNSGGGQSVGNTTALTISGTPPASIQVGSKYFFQPTTTAASGAALIFSITGKPAWVLFDTATGTLTGSPTAADVGHETQIQIKVSDGTANVGLAAFVIAVKPASTSAVLTISGTASDSILVGSRYSFQPTVTDVPGASFTFAIANQPSWAAFDAATGRLTGTPSASNIGVYDHVEISVSDGQGHAALNPFSIAVTTGGTQSLTLYWTAPSVNADGSGLTDLAGYHIYYGKSSSQLSTVISVEGAGITSQVLNKLPQGTWYFAVTAFNSDKIESKFSAVLSLTI